MERNRRLVVLTLLCFALTAMVRLQDTARAELQVSLTASLRGQNATITITPTGASASCEFTLRGAPSANRLAGDAETITWSGDAVTVDLEASQIPGLREEVSRRRVFLQAVAHCGSETAESAVQRLTVRRLGNVRSSAQWVEQLFRRLVPGQVTVANAFPNLTFTAPVDFQSFPDGSHRLAVVEQAGTIRSFANSSLTSSSDTFLDIDSRVKSGGERGLLGLAFHPNYATNGYLFVNYTREPDGATVVARYEASPPSASSVSAATETILLVIDQPYSNHNGGQVAFGPDGKLYTGMGDGGSAGDPHGHGQNPATLLGSLLRIDVDTTTGGLAYGIPNDNPFVGNTKGYREETYAYGFRNPWRFSFDFTTGLLWLADVGQSAFEEVDIVSAGENYGWNIMEGAHCYSPSSGCNKRGLTLPISTYGRDAGQSITGGYVYRGTAFPALTGLYLFGDFASGTLWSLRYESGRSAVRRILLKTGLNISSFGRDAAGEVYLLNYGDGAVYRVQG